MLGKIIRHKRENVTFHSPIGFLNKVRDNYGDTLYEYDEKNRGVIMFENRKPYNGHLIKWSQLAEDMGWFDDAEIVTDRNEREKVMTWLNVN